MKWEIDSRLLQTLLLTLVKVTFKVGYCITILQFYIKVGRKYEKETLYNRNDVGDSESADCFNVCWNGNKNRYE